MGKESDPFMKNILDKRQLLRLPQTVCMVNVAQKLVHFTRWILAASTTATGRKLLIYAKDIIENVYNNINVDTKHGNMKINEYIYGDTDSVFFTFNLKDPNTNKDVRGQKALEVTIDLAKEAIETCDQISKRTTRFRIRKNVHAVLFLISKKRYVGMLYEEDHINVSENQWVLY